MTSGPVVVGGAQSAAAAPACGAVLVAGSSWLGGTGVDVLSNGAHQGTGYNCGSESYAHPATQDGNAWQCVELAARLYYVKGWGTVHAGGNGGAAYIPEGSPSLTFHPNGSGYIPVPGDLLVFNATSTNAYGHVAVVDTVAGGVVNEVEENASVSGRRSFAISGSTISGGVRGVEHSPKNTNVGTGSDELPALATVDSAGHAYAKLGLGGTWLHEIDSVSAIAVASDPVNGPSLAVVSGGSVFAKQGLSGAWIHETDGFSSVALASDATNGPTLVVRSGSGKVYAKTGLGGAWVHETDGVSAIAVASDATNGPSIAVLTGHTVLAKHGLGGTWITETNGSTGIALASDATRGPVLVTNNGGKVYAKQGLGGTWIHEIDGVSAISAASDPSNGPSLAVVSGSSVYAKQGLGGTWILETNGSSAIALSSDATAGPSLASVNGGTVYAKQGLGGTWLNEIGSMQRVVLAG